MQGKVSGRHPSPHRGSSVEFAEYRKYVPGDDLRRLDWRAYGRTRSVLHQRIRSRHEFPLLPGARHQRLDGFHFAQHHQNRIRPPTRRGHRLVGVAARGRGRVIVRRRRRGFSIPPRRNPAHLSVVFDLLEQARPKGETKLIPILHELGETIRQRALIVIMSDFFVESDELRSCFEHLRFRKHDIAAFHLLDPLELEFTFRRPMRFLDMEGGAAVFAEPNEIAERYHTVLRKYLASVKEIVRESAIDYHRVPHRRRLRTDPHAISRRPYSRRRAAVTN